MAKKQKGPKRAPVVSDSTPTPDISMTATETPTPTEGQAVADILAPANSETGNESAALSALDAAENFTSSGDVQQFPSEGVETSGRVEFAEPPKRGRGRPPGARTRPNGSAPGNSPVDRDRRSKSELAARVAELEKENAGLRPSDGQAIEQAKSALQVTFKVVGVMLSQWRGDHWQFSDDESKALAEGWAPPLAPYLVHSAEALKWVAALGVTWTVVAPRLAKDRETQTLEIAPGVEVRTVAKDS